MKFYTNPNFFFELWREAMLRQVEKEKNNKKLVQRQSKLQNGILQEGKKPRQPANSNDRYRKMVSQQEFLIGEELPNKNVIYMSSNNDAHYEQYDTIRQNNPMNVYGTYNGNAAGQQQQQPHYAYHNGIPHPHQHLHQQINGNANYINQMNSITPPPSYQQMQPHPYGQPEQFNSQMQTLSRRTSRPSQPPPEPPQLMNGHPNASHNEYHQTNGYVSHYSQSNIGHHQMNGHPNEYHQTNGYLNHYSQSNLNPHQQQANLNESSNNPELVNVKRPQSLSREVLGLPPPVPNMSNGNDSSSSTNMNNGNHLNNLPLPPPLPVNVNGRLVSSASLQQQHSTSSSASNQSTASSQPPANIPPPPPPMPSSIPPAPSAVQIDVTDNAKSSNSNNSSINSSKPLAVRETTFEQEILQKQKQLQPIKHINRPPPKSDPRNDLLAAIREGIKLKRVEDSKQKEVEKSEHLLDVASILARRVAMELSDSESNDSEDSNNDWNDESHV